MRGRRSSRGRIRTVPVSACAPLNVPSTCDGPRSPASHDHADPGSRSTWSRAIRVESASAGRAVTPPRYRADQLRGATCPPQSNRLVRGGHRARIHPVGHTPGRQRSPGDRRGPRRTRPSRLSHRGPSGRRLSGIPRPGPCRRPEQRAALAICLHHGQPGAVGTPQDRRWAGPGDRHRGSRGLASDPARVRRRTRVRGRARAGRLAAPCSRRCPDGCRARRPGGRRADRVEPRGPRRRDRGGARRVELERGRDVPHDGDAVACRARPVRSATTPHRLPIWPTCAGSP